jgi:hypothetical protein
LVSIRITAAGQGGHGRPAYHGEVIGRRLDGTTADPRHEAVMPTPANASAAALRASDGYTCSAAFWAIEVAVRQTANQHLDRLRRGIGGDDGRCVSGCVSTGTTAGNPVLASQRVKGSRFLLTYC